MQKLSIANWLAVGSTGKLSPHDDLNGYLDPRMTPTLGEVEYFLQLRPAIDGEYLDDRTDGTPTTDALPGIYTHPAGLGRALNERNPRGIAYFSHYAPLNVQTTLDFPTPGISPSPTVTPTPLPAHPVIVAGSVVTVVGEETGQMLMATPAAMFSDRMIQVYGGYYTGFATRGGTNPLVWKRGLFPVFDYLHIVGTGNFAITALHDQNQLEPDHTEWKFRRCFVDSVVSQQNEALIARNPSVGSGFDVVERSQDTGLSLSEPIIRFLAGSTSTVHLDQKEFGSLDPPVRFYRDQVDLAGQVVRATAHWARIVNFIPGKLINIGRLRAMRVTFDFLETESAGTLQDDRRAGSKIGHLIGMEVRAPQYVPKDSGSPGTEVDIKKAIGMSVVSQFNGHLARNLSRRGEPDVSLEFLEKTAATGIRSAGLVANGDVVIGDGISQMEQSGYDTDVLHCRDILRLASSIPTPGELQELPIWERSGILSYGKPSPTEAEGLWLSVPDKHYFEDGGIGVVWVRLKAENDEHLGHPTSQPIGFPLGISVYPLGDSTSSGQTTVGVDLSGGPATEPLVYWREVWFGSGRQQLPFKTPWQRVYPPKESIERSASAPDGPIEHLEFSIKLNTSSSGSSSAHAVEVSIVNPVTGQAVSGSIAANALR